MLLGFFLFFFQGSRACNSTAQGYHVSTERLVALYLCIFAFRAATAGRNFFSGGFCKRRDSLIAICAQVCFPVEFLLQFVVFCNCGVLQVARVVKFAEMTGLAGSPVCWPGCFAVWLVASWLVWLAGWLAG